MAEEVSSEFEDAQEVLEYGVLDVLVDLPDFSEFSQEAAEAEGVAAAALTSDADQAVGGAPSPAPELTTEIQLPHDESPRRHMGTAELSPAGGGPPPAPHPQHQHQRQRQQQQPQQLQPVITDGVTPSAADKELDSRLRSAFRSMWGPRHILLKDKLSFLLGCSMLWWVLAHLPRAFRDLFCTGNYSC